MSPAPSAVSAAERVWRTIRAWGVRLHPLACATLIIGLAYAYRFSTVDDAWISLRYARNLLEGHGLVYNPGERVEGYSNFLWVILSVPLLAAGLEPGLAVQLLGVAAAGLCLWGTGRLARALGLSEGGVALSRLLLAASGPFVAWTISGLETPLVAALAVLLAISLLADTARAGVSPPSGVLAGLGIMLRLDFGLLVLAAAVWKLWADRQAGRSLRLRAWLAGGAPLAAIAGPYMAWRFAYFGDWLPNTYYAKVGATWWQVLRGVRYLMQYPLNFGGALVCVVLPALGLVAVRQRDAAGAALLAAFLGAQCAYVVLIGGEGLGMSRFLVPVAPLACVLTAAAPSLCARGAGWGLVPASMATGTLLSILGGSLYGMLPRSHIHWAGGVRRALEVGGWFRDHSPPGATLAVLDAGALPYAARRYTIDMQGLNDRTIARVRVADMGKGKAGHEKRDPEYVLARRPDYVLVRDDDSALSAGLRARGYSFAVIVTTDGQRWGVWCRPGLPQPPPPAAGAPAAE